MATPYHLEKRGKGQRLRRSLGVSAASVARAETEVAVRAVGFV